MALSKFGALLRSISAEDFEKPNLIFQIGMVPRRIDLLTSIDGVEFDQAYSTRKIVPLGGLTVPVIGRDDLLINKRASGRPKDLADVAWLEAEKSNGK